VFKKTKAEQDNEDVVTIEELVEEEVQQLY